MNHFLRKFVEARITDTFKFLDEHFEYTHKVESFKKLQGEEAWDISITLTVEDVNVPLTLHFDDDRIYIYEFPEQDLPVEVDNEFILAAIARALISKEKKGVA